MSFNSFIKIWFFLFYRFSVFLRLVWFQMQGFGVIWFELNVGFLCHVCSWSSLGSPSTTFISDQFSNTTRTNLSILCCWVDCSALWIMKFGFLPSISTVVSECNGMLMVYPNKVFFLMLDFMCRELMGSFLWNQFPFLERGETLPQRALRFHVRYEFLIWYLFVITHVTGISKLK